MRGVRVVVEGGLDGLVGWDGVEGGDEVGVGGGIERAGLMEMECVMFSEVLWCYLPTIQASDSKVERERYLMKVARSQNSDIVRIQKCYTNLGIYI